MNCRSWIELDFDDSHSITIATLESGEPMLLAHEGENNAEIPLTNTTAFRALIAELQRVLAETEVK